MDNLYLPIYYEWGDYTEELTDEEFGALIRALIDYSKEGNVCDELGGTSQVAYKFITSAIRRSQAKRLAGQKGGLAKAAKAAKNKLAKNSVETSAAGEWEKATPPAERTEDVTDNTHGKAGAAEHTDFTPPTRECVRGFFKSKEFVSDADEFYNFYESNGWRVGQNSMQNWYASAENWELKQKRAHAEQKRDGTSEQKPRYGSFDVKDAFQRALERSYGKADTTV